MNTRFQDYCSMTFLSVSALVLLATLSLLDSDWGADAAGQDRDSALHLSRHRMLGKKNNAPLNGLFFGKRQSGSGLFFGKRQSGSGLFFGKRQSGSGLFFGKRATSGLFFGKRQDYRSPGNDVIGLENISENDVALDDVLSSGEFYENSRSAAGVNGQLQRTVTGDDVSLLLPDEDSVRSYNSGDDSARQ